MKKSAKEIRNVIMTIWCMIDDDEIKTEKDVNNLLKMFGEADEIKKSNNSIIYFYADKDVEVSFFKSGVYKIFSIYLYDLDKCFPSDKNHIIQKGVVTIIYPVKGRVICINKSKNLRKDIRRLLF